MSEHYYSSLPTSASHIREFSFTYREERILFETDNGVFSKNEVDAGSAVLLNALPEEMEGTLLDIGCGWGAMGVSLGKKYPALSVTMADVNERALELCRRNAEKNGVKAEILVSDACAAVEGSFSHVITNPPIRAGKQVIYRFFSEAAGHLAPGGALYAVIRKQQGAPSAIRYMQTLYAEVSVIERSGGYWVIRCREPLEHT